MHTKIKFFIMDVDGTLTDGKIYMGNDGELCKAFCIKDGCGIHDILIPAGIRPIIITGRKSKILENRCKEIGSEQSYSRPPCLPEYRFHCHRPYKISADQY